MELPGNLGGMRADAVLFASMEEEHVQCCRADGASAVSDDAWRQANEDFEMLKSVLCRTRKRKAVPEWAVPVELWWMLLHPARRMREDRVGVGAEESRPADPLAQEAIFVLLLHVRRVRRVPLR